MKHALFTFLLLICNFANAQNYKAIIAVADKLYDDKVYDKSVAKYKEAFAIEQKSTSDCYNAACAAALLGEKKLAMRWLNLSFDNGWTNINHLSTDTDLTILHGSRKWNKLLADMQKVVDKREANYDKPLQAKLLAIHDDDQIIRNQFIAAQKKYGYQSKQADSLSKIMQYRDSVDLVKIVEILDKYGWVGADKVGGTANQTLFLVIQHSDLKTQQKYLPMMREAVKNKNASGSSLALLEDRVGLGEGKRQVYGSQIGRNNDTQKHFVLPLDDPDNVDKRRAEVGLGPLADYVKKWDIEWNIEDYKKQLPEIEAKRKKDSE